MEDDKPKFPSRMNLAEDSSTTMKADIQQEILKLFGDNEMTWEGAKSYFTNTPEPQFGDMSGFAWQTEGFRVKPTCPLKDTGSTNPIGFKVDKNIRIPEVRFLGTSKLNLPFQDFEYELQRYDGTPTANAQALERIVFITHSGSLGVYVPSRFFMRFKDIQDRICGEYQERVKLFALDWLAGATFQTSIDKYFSLNLTMDKTTSTDKDRDAAAKIVDAMGKRRSHLPIWDQDGELLDWEQSAKILGGFLVPSMDDEDKTVELMPALYFRNFCRLLVAAATTPRISFTVMARFWSHEIPNQGEIEFRYTLPQGGKGLTKDDKEFWKANIKLAHVNVVENLKKKIHDYPHKKPTTFIPSIDCKVEPETDAGDKDSYIWVTSHPQGLYDLSIHEEQYPHMEEEATFRPGYENTPSVDEDLHSPAIDFWKSEIKNPEPPKPTTYTIITQKKLGLAATWPRKYDQNTVMNGKTAHQVAKDLFGDNNLPERGRAEWLHRSAYSFGGLNEGSGPPTDHGPDSSQDQCNLVIGTYAANTRMIKYEEYLKRLVDLADLQATLKTSLSYEDLKYLDKDYKWPYAQDSPLNSSWIAPVLNYNWKIYDTDGDKELASGGAKFWLFSRNAPMRFEAMLDRALDQKLYKLYNPKKYEPDKPKVRALLEALWKNTPSSVFV